VFAVQLDELFPVRFDGLLDPIVELHPGRRTPGDLVAAPTIASLAPLFEHLLEFDLQFLRVMREVFPGAACGDRLQLPSGVRHEVLDVGGEYLARKSVRVPDERRVHLEVVDVTTGRDDER
jgi:hypothetical protein